mgnify:CR=1 FL=1
MEDSIINDNVKSYLVACLVSGIHVKADPHNFMTGLVDHMNSLVDRVYWAQGDEDGIILHDKFDLPVLNLTYSNDTLKFMMFDQKDEYLELTSNKDAGFMLLNILGYIREQGLECEPEAVRHMRTVASSTSPYDKTITQDDWSL